MTLRVTIHNDSSETKQIELWKPAPHSHSPSGRTTYLLTPGAHLETTVYEDGGSLAIYETKPPVIV
jgi:hypothetical protein